jgi:hypothetical protein
MTIDYVVYPFVPIVTSPRGKRPAPPRKGVRELSNRDIYQAATKYADYVMNTMKPDTPRRQQLAHWNVAFEAFKRGARWAKEEMSRRKTVQRQTIKALRRAREDK